METKTIKLDFVKKGNNIACSDLATLGLILGTRGIAGNLNVYKVRKEKDTYVLHINNVKKRIRELENRKAKIDDYLRIMKQIVK